MVIIPARMGATRFPGKPLIDLCGKPMIQWVYERASKAAGVSRVMVATCDQEIIDTVTRVWRRGRDDLRSTSFRYR